MYLISLKAKDVPERKGEGSVEGEDEDEDVMLPREWGIGQEGGLVSASLRRDSWFG